jgi:branched-chain amino acid aminotransferase
MLLLNGKWISPDAPELSLLNRSFKYGDGLFESIRVFEGRVLFWEDHWKRLQKGLHILQFEFDAEVLKAVLTGALEEIISKNKIHDHGRLRLHLYRAGAGAYLPIENRPFYLLEGYSIKGDTFVEHTPVRLTDFHDIKLPFDALSPIKTANSLPYVLASLHAKKTGFDDALLYMDGWISEASSSNIFLVFNKKLFTPPLKHACLDGVMRKQIIQLAHELKIPFQEKGIKSKDLIQAEEAFLTNTIRGITSISQYQDYIFDTKKAGITSLLKRSLYALGRSGREEQRVESRE